MKVDDPELLPKVKGNKEVESKKKKKLEKSSSNKVEKKSEDVATSKVADMPIVPPEKSISTISSLYAIGSVFADTIVSDGLLHTTTYLRYVGIGARYIEEQETESPWGLRLSIMTGLPVKKDNYQFPVYRSIESEIYKGKIYSHFRLLGGFDFSPIYFVNLANPGEGLKVFENDFFWIKAGGGFNYEFFGKEFDFRAIGLLSLTGKNNQKKSINGNSISFSLNYQHDKRHAAELIYRKNKMVGDLSVAGQSVYLSYLYKFEN